ncbi:unnamed protein product [Spodoptera littoralis]|uniref:Uncharacterized protein n=1 Tax=Spodoptera littoralis TaxID=7109 RepID=A0A9P0N006_SPOLI|nr:unnamed protein product [Spodoptera littoralis]CAH1637518.1 unnamed protein product [Spodoptera littoralis]
MPNFNLIGLKLTKAHINFHPLFYPLGGGNYQNPFTADAYVITSICMPNFNPIDLKLTMSHTNFHPLFYPPIDLKLTMSHTNFHPLFYPLGGGNYQNPFLADAYVITSICMPNFSPICPAVWAVR